MKKYNTSYLSKSAWKYCVKSVFSISTCFILIWGMYLKTFVGREEPAYPAIVNTIAADVLVTWETRTSSAMVLT